MRKKTNSSSRNLLRIQDRSPEEAVPYLLKSLHLSLRQVLDQALREAGVEISFAHLTTMLELEAEPGLVGAELARRASVTAQTMNTILHRLAREGQIERRPHPTTPRADRWFVTRSGQKQLDAATKVGRAVWRSMLSTFAARETAQLRDLLGRCLIGLEAQVQTPRRAAARATQDAPVRRASRRTSTSRS